MTNKREDLTFEEVLPLLREGWIAMTHFEGATARIRIKGGEFQHEVLDTPHGVEWLPLALQHRDVVDRLYDVVDRQPMSFDAALRSCRNGNCMKMDVPYVGTFELKRDEYEDVKLYIPDGATANDFRKVLDGEWIARR